MKTIAELRKHPGADALWDALEHLELRINELVDEGVTSGYPVRCNEPHCDAITSKPLNEGWRSIPGGQQADRSWWNCPLHKDERSASIGGDSLT